MVVPYTILTLALYSIYCDCIGYPGHVTVSAILVTDGALQTEVGMLEGTGEGWGVAGLLLYPTRH